MTIEDVGGFEFVNGDQRPGDDALMTSGDDRSADISGSGQYSSEGIKIDSSG